jgi:hypothetical protein
MRTREDLEEASSKGARSMLVRVKSTEEYKVQNRRIGQVSKEGYRVNPDVIVERCLTGFAAASETVNRVESKFQKTA